MPRFPNRAHEPAPAHDGLLDGFVGRPLSHRAHRRRRTRTSLRVPRPVGGVIYLGTAFGNARVDCRFGFLDDLLVGRASFIVRSLHLRMKFSQTLVGKLRKSELTHLSTVRFGKVGDGIAHEHGRNHTDRQKTDKDGPSFHAFHRFQEEEPADVAGTHLGMLTIVAPCT